MERWWRKFVLRARSLFRTRDVEAELDEELRFHLESRIEQGLARGLTPDAARRAAMISLEGIEQQKEACRETRGIQWLDHLARDVRHGTRVLRAQPGFTIAAVLSLALGIGANTAIFQVIDAVRLRHLPVPHPEALAEVQIIGGNRGFGISDGDRAQVTYPLWQRIQQQQQSFSGVFAWGKSGFLVGQGADARPVRGLWLSGEAFPTLGLRPALGRLFNVDDDRPGCAPSIVLSHAFWQSQFGGDPAVTGRTLLFFDRSLPVLGVAPQTFFGLEVGTRFDVALPTCAAAIWGGQLDRRDWFWLSVVGRLKDDWTIDRAASDVHAQSAAMFEATEPSGYSDERRAFYRAYRLTAVPAGTGVSGIRDEYGDALWLLLAMTGLVLVLACTNVMNLLLARASAREHEMALRVALGASRGRVVTQLLVESLLLASAGSLVGAAIARPLSARLVSLLSTEGNPLYLDLQSHWPVLAFTAAIGVAACLLFGLVPALRASQMDPGLAVKTGGRGLTAARERLVVQRSLVVAQVVVSLVLIFGATLFVKTFSNLVHVDLGVKQDNLIVARLADVSARPTPEQVASQQHDLLEAIRSLPEVVSAAGTTKVPMDGSSWTFALDIPGADPSQDTTSKFTYVSPKYFDTVGMRILEGRDLAETDTSASKRVVVVNQRFVRQHLPNVTPLGALVRTVAEPGFPETVYEVVGVVSDTKYSIIRETQPRAIAYVPNVQHPNLRRLPALLIRTSGPGAPVVVALKRTIAERYPNMTMGFSMLDADIREGLLRERLLAWLAGAFGVVAALLAFVGIYGVIAYVVQRRRHELAIRLALGAGRPRIVRLVAGQLGVLLIVGLALGVGLAVTVARVASGLLFGLSWHDPAALATSFAVLTAIAAIACAVPALRASRIEATSALRSE